MTASKSNKIPSKTSFQTSYDKDIETKKETLQPQISNPRINETSEAMSEAQIINEQKVIGRDVTSPQRLVQYFLRLEA